MKRLRYIRLLTLPVLLLTTGACSHDDATADGATTTPTDSPTTEARGIGFGASTVDSAGSNGTRTDPDPDYRGKGMLSTELLRQVGFGVYCWYTGSTRFDNFANGQTHIKDYTIYELMRNQKVEWAATVSQPSPHWTYAPAKYWPLEPDEMLTLRAYAPYTNYLTTDSRGLPMLPVVVKADDYCNNCQHDPLWGTSKHDEGGDHPTGNEWYGTHYDNYTYVMSGDELTKDERDGVIDWYFHHGMTRFALQVRLQKATGTEVRVTKIKTGPFYNEGLLDIFRSPTTSKDTKPIWEDRQPLVGDAGDDFFVTMAYGHDTTDPAHNDLLDVVIDDEKYTNVALYGLLVIPREFTAEHPMEIEVTYTNGGTEQTAVAHLVLNAQGNTTYALQLLLDSENNSVNAFVNLDWQTGTYDLLDGL